jgi:hypothetical protein
MQENQATENNEVIVDQPIEENLQEAVETKEEEITTEEEIAETEAPENNELDSDGDGEDENDPFPKKATRALERRNKKINKLRAEKAELEQKLASYANNPPPQEQQIDNQSIPDGLKEPQEDDFEDYAEYLKAVGKFEVEREYATKEAQAQQQREVESQQQWVRQRAEQIDARAAEVVKTIPELEGLYRENQDIIEGYSNTTKMAFLEADAPEMAFYALAQEGRLEELDGMTPTKIAREIALAEIRGQKLSKSRPQSKAPAPIKKAKGTGTRRKTLDDMSPSELLNHLKNNK